MRLTLDKQNEYAHELATALSKELGQELVDAIVHADQSNEAGIDEQRSRVAELKRNSQIPQDSRAKDLIGISQLAGKEIRVDHGRRRLGIRYRLRRSRPCACQRTQCQCAGAGYRSLFQHGWSASKCTPRGTVAKFAMSGKGLPKKDLGLITMAYGYVYVARVPMGYNDQQTLKAFLEARVI